MKAGWKEGQQKEIALPEEDEDTFNRFVGWPYTRQVACKTLDDYDHTLLSELYILGERLLASEFENAVMDCMIFRGLRDGMWPGWDVASKFYESTPKGSPSRKWILDVYSQLGDGSWSDDIAETNGEFLQDLVTALMAKRGTPKVLNSDNVSIALRKTYHKPVKGA